jgi:plastocyanin
LRRLRHLSLAAVSVLLVTACSQATAGWTYAPAPSKTPAPAASGSGAPGSAAPSGGASGAPASAAPSGGASGAPSGQPSAGGSGQLVVVKISATGIKYDQDTLTAPASTPFQIEFTNNDAGVPHNVSLHTGGAQGAEIFKGVIFPGVATHAYDIQALDAGSYSFVCSVHPTMIGTLNVQ